MVQVHPSSRNVIPGRVKFSIDLRNASDALVDQMADMARLAPSGMIFIPCKAGISHNEIEDAKTEHIAAGCNVLLHAMLERAGT